MIPGPADVPHSFLILSVQRSTTLSQRSLRCLVIASTFPASVEDPTPGFVRDLSEQIAERCETLALVPMVPGAAARERSGRLEIRRFRYFPRRWEDVADGAILDNLRARPSRWLQVLPLLVCEWLAIRRAVATFEPDVIQAHWLVPQGLMARLAAPRVPLVVTAHGGDVYALTNGPARWVKRWGLRQAAAVTAPNRDMCTRLIGLGSPPERTTPGPMGADVTAVSAARAGPRDPGRLLFVGRLVEKKGVSTLLTALQRLDPAIPWSLDVVGNGPLRDRLEAEAAPLGDRVRFRGGLPRRAVIAELASCGIFVLPSVIAASGDQEGLPVALIEAMAAGCPIVASRLPGIDEALDDANGVLVAPGDPQALAGALARLLADDAQRQRLGAAAAEAAEAYSLEAVGARFAALITRAATAAAIPARQPAARRP